MNRAANALPAVKARYWMMHLIERIERWRSRSSRMHELLHSVAKQMQNKCLCPLGEFATMAVTTAIERFPADFQPSTARRQPWLKWYP